MKLHRLVGRLPLSMRTANKNCEVQAFEVIRGRQDMKFKFKTKKNIPTFIIEIGPLENLLEDTELLEFLLRRKSIN